ncbi:hypothetical protein SNE35_28620 [Paucibacter sp. R3-3]|uniref:NlpC/P60 domain-containing protein n=1 Tax=Roseateles agri TaxID=3098619 RepID=A0ABU5DQB8_9BURK|nr:hypothetical protein [Paucibacter sp. R3-3]MDY0748498.1 hypothetical protein [Paucibacter sp. R3-3]
MDINAYLPRQYGTPPCWDLVTDVWKAERGLGVTRYKTVNAKIRSIAAAFRLALHKGPEGLTPIAEPQDLCIVLLGKSEQVGLHHCGIYWQGSVLHALTEGNLYQDMASIRDAYALIEFWDQVDA